MTPGSDVVVREVGVNGTRVGFLDALRAMGADAEIGEERDLDGEPVADVRVRYRPLRGVTLDGDLIVRSIDEVTILACVAAHAVGTTRIRDAGDLRGKESDRLSTIAETLRLCGISVEEYPDGLDIVGGGAHAPARTLATHDDHRIAMAVAALAAPTGPHGIDDRHCIAVSFPDFVPLWEAAQRAV